MRNDYDPRSVEILFEVYWSTTGWKQPFGAVSQADFEHAKAADVMFPPIRRSLEILGYADVFVYPGYTTHYNAGEPTDNRPYRGGEWNAPAAMWQVRDGINSEAVAQYFPAFARDLLSE